MHGKSSEELRAMLLAGPPVGSTWRHRKGGLYTVVMLAIRESDLSAVVLYRGPDGFCWDRPLSEFADGRFTMVDGGGGDDA